MRRCRSMGAIQHSRAAPQSLETPYDGNKINIILTRDGILRSSSQPCAHSERKLDRLQEENIGKKILGRSKRPCDPNKLSTSHCRLLLLLINYTFRDPRVVAG